MCCLSACPAHNNRSDSLDVGNVAIGSDHACVVCLHAPQESFVELGSVVLGSDHACVVCQHAPQQKVVTGAWELELMFTSSDTVAASTYALDIGLTTQTTNQKHMPHTNRNRHNKPKIAHSIDCTHKQNKHNNNQTQRYSSSTHSGNDVVPSVFLLGSVLILAGSVV